MSNENALSIIYTHCPPQILGQRECYISFVIKLYNNYPCMNEILTSDRLVNKMCWVRRNHFFPSDRLRTSTGFGRCQQMYVCVVVCVVCVYVCGGVGVWWGVCVWWCVCCGVCVLYMCVVVVCVCVVYMCVVVCVCCVCVWCGMCVWFRVCVVQCVFVYVCVVCVVGCVCVVGWGGGTNSNNL